MSLGSAGTRWSGDGRAIVRVGGLRTTLALLRDPTAFLARCRRRHGDSFRCRAFGFELLFLFSPEGLRSLWGLRESEASKGLADLRLLSHKVPDELFAGRRTRPHDLFARDDVAFQLDVLRESVAIELDELGTAGELELFAFARRLSHRVGLASWGGLAGPEPERRDALVRCFDALDSSESFVHPPRALFTVLSGKRRERAALAELEGLYAGILRERGDADDATFFGRIRENWSDADEPERSIGIARDVALLHMASQSNLFAALAWTAVHLLERPALLERVRAGDGALIERCAHESIRLRQRSIVLREALRPLWVRDEEGEIPVARGDLVATMMSVTNREAPAGSGLDLERFDPEHYPSPRFARAAELPTPEWVSTFGHGRHSCPAQRFAVLAIREALSELVARFELEPRFRSPGPLRHQIGGVARADRPCRVRYRREAHPLSPSSSP